LKLPDLVDECNREKGEAANEENISDLP